MTVFVSLPMKSAQSLCHILERVEQGDEEADALEVGATGDALIGAVDASVALVIVDHKGGEADALVANALVVGSIGRANHGRGNDADRSSSALGPPQTIRFPPSAWDHGNSGRRWRGRPRAPDRPRAGTARARSCRGPAPLQHVRQGPPRQPPRGSAPQRRPRSCPRACGS